MHHVLKHFILEHGCSGVSGDSARYLSVSGCPAHTASRRTKDDCACSRYSGGFFLYILSHLDRVLMSSGLAKTIIQSTVKGKRRRGRQKKRREDNIKRWTGMDFASSSRAAENRTGWKGIVAKLCVVPVYGLE